jgi:hypothetical protein
MRGHEIHGFDGAQRDDEVVAAPISHHADGAHRQNTANAWLVRS